MTEASPAAVEPPSPTKTRPRASRVSVEGTKSPAPPVVPSYVAKTVTPNFGEPLPPAEESGVSFHTVRAPASVTSAYVSPSRPSGVGATTITALGTAGGGVVVAVVGVAGVSPGPWSAVPSSEVAGALVVPVGGVVGTLQFPPDPASVTSSVSSSQLSWPGWSRPPRMTVRSSLRPWSSPLPSWADALVVAAPRSRTNDPAVTRVLRMVDPPVWDSSPANGYGQRGQPLM